MFQIIANITEQVERDVTSDIGFSQTDPQLFQFVNFIDILYVKMWHLQYKSCEFFYIPVMCNDL